MKKLLGPALIILLGASFAESGTVDRIIAKINDEIITQSELNRELEPLRKDLKSRYSGDQLQKALQKAEQDGLQSMIEDKLIYQKAVELEYEADAEEKVDQYIKQIMRDNSIKDTDELEEALIREGKTLREYKEYLQRRIITDGLVNDFINARISLLTSEIEQYYKNHLSNYTAPEEVTLSEIMVTEADESGDAQSHANDLYRRLQQGESFTVLARQYSKGPTAENGGSIGTYLLDKLNPDTIKVIAQLKEGEVSRPQKLETGFVLYRLDGRKESTVRPLDEVKDEIKNILYRQKRNPEYERFITQLREEAYIQIFPEMQ